MALYFPLDAVTTGAAIDADLMADYLELSAFFAGDSKARTSEISDAASLGGEEDHGSPNDQIEVAEEEIIAAAIDRIETRRLVLGSAYPFKLDDAGEVLTCDLDQDSLGQAAYVLSLVLSNLRSISPLLGGSDLHPHDEDVRSLREYFQYVATAALAAEVQGRAWSFGFPRPDHSGFLAKLQKIWLELRDGHVARQTGAPRQPKDDKIDVFAARLQPDKLPGFLVAAAQVATGREASEKTIKGHLGTFKSRWFRTQPVTDFIAYMIVPFARSDDEFLDDVRAMGNVLHRLRVPRRVAEAEQLALAGVPIEAYDRLPEVASWVARYRSQARAAP